LTKRFGSLTAVDHLSISIEGGEVFGFLGPNGAGKTTTVRMLACLISPSEGSAKVGGHDVSVEPMRVRGMVGILTENPSLYERLTVYENLDFFAEAYGLPDARGRQDRIKELLDFFELWERRNDKTGKLSKGMKQKLAIARTLVHSPPVLLLDEPTAGLDPESAKGIRDLIASLSHRENHTILLCTHHLEDADKLCNRVMIVNRGRSVVVGTPEELRDRIAGKPKLQVTLRKVDQTIVQAVRAVEQVREIHADEDAANMTITVDDLSETTPEIVSRIVHAGGLVLSVATLRPSLEEAYLKLVREEQS
jgi:ABC-2 type transport system ATP-binding protein